MPISIQKNVCFIVITLLLWTTLAAAKDDVVSGLRKHIGQDYADEESFFAKAWHEQKILQRSALVHRQLQTVPSPKINEVMFLPNPTSADFRERKMFIEIYRMSGSRSLSGCRLENDDGSFRVDFDESVDSVDATYFVVKHKSTLGSEYLFWKQKAILWVRDFALKEIDGVGLSCGEELIDFVAWGKEGVGPNGALHSAAVDAGMWSSIDDFIETAGSREQIGGFVIQGLQKGDSLGRDAASTDTNSVADWSYHGGFNARGPTPSAQNLNHIALPLINEVLFRPDPYLPENRKRRAFVEIYRRDTSFSLSGCSLLNNDGSFLVNFGSLYDSVNDEYFSVKHKSSLKTRYELSRKHGILWMRDFFLDENVDGVALFCDGTMVDYVAWGTRLKGPDGTLHSAAVAFRMWSGNDDFVQLAPKGLGDGYNSPDLKVGDSLGRDRNSTDTNGPSDWTPGGATPSTRNVDHFALPSGPGSIAITAIFFEKGKQFGNWTEKYPGQPDQRRVYRRGDTFDIQLQIDGLPADSIELTIYGPAGYGWQFDTITCSQQADGIKCQNGLKSLNQHITFINWTTFEVTLLNPEIINVPVGRYRVFVGVRKNQGGSDSKESLRDFNKTFCVVFNPFSAADTEVFAGGENLLSDAYVYSQNTGAAAKDEFGVWFYANEVYRDGSWWAQGRQETFDLRPFSEEIFARAIDILDRGKRTSAKPAYSDLSKFVDDHLIANPAKVQYDVKHLFARGTHAQCASQANFLVAHLRSVGIISFPNYVDSNVWKMNQWTFHTWVVAKIGDAWLAVDPFTSLNAPTTLRELGKTSVAYDELHNDLMGFGSFLWTFANDNKRVYHAIFSGDSPLMDASPNGFFGSVTRDSIMENSREYWGPWYRRLDETPVSGEDLNVTISTDARSYGPSDTVTVTARLLNNLNTSQRVSFATTLKGDYLLTQDRNDYSEVVYDEIVDVPAYQEVEVTFDFVLSAVLRADYYYLLEGSAIISNTNETSRDETSSTLAVTSFNFVPSFNVTNTIPRCAPPSNKPIVSTVVIANTGTANINDMTLDLNLLPEIFTLVESELPSMKEVLKPGEELTTTLSFVGENEGAGTLSMLISTSNGGNIERLFTVVLSDNCTAVMSPLPPPPMAELLKELPF